MLVINRPSPLSTTHLLFLLLTSCGTERSTAFPPLLSTVSIIAYGEDGHKLPFHVTKVRDVAGGPVVVLPSWSADESRLMSRYGVELEVTVEFDIMKGRQWTFNKLFVIDDFPQIVLRPNLRNAATSVESAWRISSFLVEGVECKPEETHWVLVLSYETEVFQQAPRRLQVRNKRFQMRGHLYGSYSFMSFCDSKLVGRAQIDLRGTQRNALIPIRFY
jgi:hypothetical protein